MRRLSLGSHNTGSFNSGDYNTGYFFGDGYNRSAVCGATSTPARSSPAITATGSSGEVTTRVDWPFHNDHHSRNPLPLRLECSNRHTHHRHRRRHHAKQFHHSRFPDTSLAWCLRRCLSTDDRPHHDPMSIKSSPSNSLPSANHQHGWHRRLGPIPIGISISGTPGFRQLDHRPVVGFLPHRRRHVSGFRTSGAGSAIEAPGTSAWQFGLL